MKLHPSKDVDILIQVGVLGLQPCITVKGPHFQSAESIKIRDSSQDAKDQSLK